MSTDINAEPYFEMDVVKENLEEQGLAAEENKIQNYGDESDREIDTELWYVFDKADFPLTAAKMAAADFTDNDFDKIKKLSNERTVAKYWFYTNSDDSLLKTSDEHVKTFVERLTTIPATVE